MTGLESLEQLKKINYSQHWVVKQFATSHLDTIEKNLKALEIILKKKVDMYFIDICENAKCYNRFFDYDKKRLLKDYEFNLLKEFYINYDSFQKNKNK